MPDACTSARQPLLLVRIVDAELANGRAWGARTPFEWPRGKILVWLREGRRRIREGEPKCARMMPTRHIGGKFEPW